MKRYLSRLSLVASALGTALRRAAVATPVLLVAGIVSAQTQVRWSSAVVGREREWYSSAEARSLADSVLLYQSPQGGWPKSTNLAVPPRTPEDIPRPGDGRANSIDNEATTLPMQFLARVTHATGEVRYREAVARGIDYLLAAQYPSGGWPQFFPAGEDYSSHITFNDDAMVHVLTLLRDAAAGNPPYAFVDDARRAQAAAAVERGVDCVLRTQVQRDGQLTAWCAQHDEKTLAPAWARKYEPPSLSGHESAGIVRFLMEIERPTPAVIAAVEGAVAWFKAVAIHGVSVETFTDAEGRRDRRIVADPSAEPLWARFYELGSDRPIFLGRDSVVRYSYGEIEHERRNGYAYYGTWPASILAKDYPRWRAKTAAAEVTATPIPGTSHPQPARVAPISYSPPSEKVKPWDRGGVIVHPDHRYLMHRDGKPFFWLGDTAWLLWARLDRDEMVRYMDSRAARGFNVLQVMTLHNQQMANWQGDPALEGGEPSKPVTTPGSDPADEAQYDFWDHVDYAFDLAEERGMYIAMVPAWNSFIESDDPQDERQGNRGRPATLNTANVAAYIQFLVERYGKRPNVVWLNGGDVLGHRAPKTFRMIGSILMEKDPEHLVTFHPFGRESSSRWFHGEPWLDLNMYQSGHRRYEQDPMGIGQDNWWYAERDWALRPTKPVLDGEPSYEALPQGLHDGKEPRWQPADVRRYAYWGVFAGGAGHTYGHAALMGMHDPTRGPNRRGEAVNSDWRDAVDAEGGNDMIHLKRLMLSRPYFERVPAQEVVIQVLPGRVVPGPDGIRRLEETVARMTAEEKMAAALESNRRTAPRLERVAATRGPGYLMVYSYTSAPFTVRLGGIAGEVGGTLEAWWYNPRTGEAAEATALGALKDEGELRVDPPGAHELGNDWVLVLDDKAAQFLPPGGFAQD